MSANLDLATAFVDLRVRGNQLDAHLNAYKQRLTDLQASTKTWLNLLESGAGARLMDRSALAGLQQQAAGARVHAASAGATARAAQTPEGQQALREQVRSNKAMEQAATAMRRAELIAERGEVMGRVAHWKEQHGGKIAAGLAVAGAAAATGRGLIGNLPTGSAIDWQIKLLAASIGRDLTPVVVYLVKWLHQLRMAWDSMPQGFRNVAAPAIAVGTGAAGVGGAAWAARRLFGMGAGAGAGMGAGGAGAAGATGAAAGGVLRMGGRLLGRAAVPVAVALGAYDLYHSLRAATESGKTWRQRGYNVGRSIFGETVADAVYGPGQGVRQPAGAAAPGRPGGNFINWMTGDNRFRGQGRGDATARTGGGTAAGGQPGGGAGDLYKLFGPPPGRPAEFIEHEDVRRQAMLAAFKDPREQELLKIQQETYQLLQQHFARVEENLPENRPAPAPSLGGAR